MITYDVYTDLPPDLLTEVAKETFRLWLNFALGQQSALGKKLKNPTGRYAASLSWKMTSPTQVAIVADETIAPEAEWVETGTDGADMKKMLAGKSKIGKDGEAYRVVPLRPDNSGGPLKFDMSRIVRGAGKGERLPASVGKMWASPRPYIDPNSRYRTIKASSPGWQVPSMPAYAPALALKQLLENELGTS